MLRQEPASLTNKSYVDEKANFEKWERSNHLSLMMVKRSVLEAFRGGIPNEITIKGSLDELEKHFAKNQKFETSKLLVDLVKQV